MKKSTIALYVLITLLVSTAAEAQNRQRSRGHSGKEILAFNPRPADPADATYAVTLGDRVRDRMDFRFRRRIDTFQTDRICEALTAFGFPCNAELTDVMIDQLADQLDADAYFLWDLRRVNGAPATTIHMIDTGRSGVSGWTTVVGEPNESARDFADAVIDSLAPQMDVANEARRCYDDRDNQNYRSAREKAHRAFRDYPNHPSSAVCLSTVFEAEGAPIDSVIMALEKAVTGDSLIPRMWQRLGQSYMQRGDSLLAANAFMRQVESDPDNLQQRLGVVLIYRGQGAYQQALDLLQYAVERNPTDVTVLNMKTDICTDAEMWGCVLETLPMVYEADSTVHGQEEFYQQVFAAAQAEADTAAMLQWSGIAVEDMPESLILWRARAQALRDAGEDQGAYSAYRRIADLDTADIRSTLSAAQIVNGWIVVDTAVPLDTGAVVLLDSLLEMTVARDSTPPVRLNVAATYLPVAASLARAQHRDLALPLLDKAILYNGGQNEAIEQQSNFWIGISLVSLISELDQQAVASESCDVVEQEAETVDRGKAAMEAGASVSQSTADRFLGFYAQFEQRVPTLRQAFCGS